MSRGGRKDQPIDRETGPVAEFVDDLRRLRGEMSLQEVGQRMRYHSSTISRRLNPAELPPLDFVRSYVEACGGDPDAWEARWRAVAGEPGSPPGLPGEPAGQPPRRGSWRLPLAAALAVVTVAGGSGYLWLSSREPGPANATPASASPPVSPASGFPWKVTNMYKQVTSREWTQHAEGDLEVWANLSCPTGMTEYWIALRPGGASARFECGSWQVHTWTGLRPGRYNFELWKDNDGRAVSGIGVVRSTSSIVQHPKPSPA
ncbi:helix-turn-helix domain-containing protein [Nonomuraea sp. NPDC059023]|uniref:helix-turn-helix domain-containing protein n=1 Tax=unclassified Nonomuraea TaxID=2593643 RepID=UPI0036A68C05